MLVETFPKKKYIKIQKKKFLPLFELGYCLGCGYNYHNLERHHIYCGNPDRSHSEQYGLYVDLCWQCHLNVTDEKDQKFITYLQQEGQRRFEQVHGKEEFKRVFGMNYL